MTPRCFIPIILKSEIQRFVESAHGIGVGSICEHGTERARAIGFDAMVSGVFYLHGVAQEPDLYVKVQRKRGNGRDAMYEVLVKIQMDEEYFHSRTEEISVGVMIESTYPGQAACELIGEFSCQLSQSEADSGWMPFERILSRDEYVDTFARGIKIKMFDFSE